MVTLSQSEYRHKTLAFMPFFTWILLLFSQGCTKIALSFFPLGHNWLSRRDRKAALRLRQTGYLVIPGFIDILHASNIRKELLKGLAELNSRNSESPSSYQFSYVELARSPQAHLDVRGLTSGKDEGMCDIFNPSLMEYHRKQIDAAFDRFKVFDIINASRLPWEQKASYSCSNFYYYKSVRTPRSLHFDSLKPHFKCFLSLSDVISEEQGPYAVIPFSHRLGFYHRLMAFCSKLVGVDYTDALFYDKKYPKKFFLKTGDLLIGDQRCVHGDTKASPQYEKAVFVTCLTSF